MNFIYSEEERKKWRKTCKKINKLYADIETEYWWCKTSRGWGLCTTAANGYKNSIERVPCYYSEDLLSILGTVELTSDDYEQFKEDELRFLATKVLEGKALKGTI